MENRGCDFSETFRKLGKGIFHPSNKQRLKLISCFGYEAFAFRTLKYSETGQVDETMSAVLW